jgi:hypothetical protein
VRPRTDQVRRTGGIREMPDSSKKTSQADSPRALFDAWPLMGHPVLDRLLVAFLSLPLGPLHAPTQPPAQQPPHRRIRQRHPGQALDHGGNAVKGPDVGREPVRQCPLQQRLLDPLKGTVGDLGAAAGRPTGPQRRFPVGLPAGMPAAGALRETSSSRATSAWERPWANNSAARSRRAWRSIRSLAARCRACCLRRLVDMADMQPHRQPAVTLT